MIVANQIARDNPLAARLGSKLSSLGYAPDELEQLVRLMCLLKELPPPPDPLGLFPDYASFKESFLAATEGGDSEVLEEAFLTLYAHLHGYEAPYTAKERRLVDETGGYWCHAGGLAPILKSAPFIRPDTVSGDFGAGNGLQTLLMQWLTPHERTVMVEISSRMVEAGRQLQSWLSIPEERVEWIVGDVLDVSPAGMDFIYLYRPVRPEGHGRRFYERFAGELEETDRSVVIFSIADCLRSFLSDKFEIFYRDGHLTCFRRDTIDQ
ncbi:MAG: class I SAM-dependent methyltransferase [Deltaproteobacteria bacterium]|nr:class I SAM-dependent methyltransferase [Deltaproteobacteria bacterium]